MRYDAAIIGAGANGLAAAATLGRAGLKVIVLERATICGGRAATHEFHPGFRASSFADEIAPIPVEIFRALDLARHGAIFAPGSGSRALWPGRRSDERHGMASDDFGHPLRAAGKRAGEAFARALKDASHVAERRWFRSMPDPSSWPGEEFSNLSLAGVIEEAIRDEDGRACLLSGLLTGRAADPFAAGSALYLLANRSGGMTMGGLAALGRALETAARAAGAEISLGLEVADLRLRGQRAGGVHLADGRPIEARAVISTLDLRRTFLSFFAWKDLPDGVTRRVSGYRHAAGRARLLLALDNPPPLGAEAARATIHIAPHALRLARAWDQWRNGVVPHHPPLALRLVTASDPGLAPAGKAVLTATLGCIPYRLFDGAWTNEKRVALREQAMAQIEEVFPGLSNRVLGSELTLSCDIEERLGVTEGDLDGGEIAPDQMFDQRGFAEHPGGRTPIRGLYLGGMSSAAGPLGTCAAGVTAARAVIADLNAGRLK